MFNKYDLELFEQKGIALEIIEKQLRFFKKGFPFMDIKRASTVGDGIIRLDDNAAKQFAAQYESKIENLQICKFVPASGAASRMFKHLYEFISSYTGLQSERELLFNEQGFNTVGNFLIHIHKFAFYDDLNARMFATRGIDIDTAKDKADYVHIVSLLLNEDGLNYGNLPKGLLKFHKYPDCVRTPLEEHLVEGANYGCDADRIVQLHFTVSPEHRVGFIQHFVEVKEKYEKQFNLKFEMQFSEQQPNTDTIAVDIYNQPFRNHDKSLAFRPGGHGALIENLNSIDADIIFIKNIDNVVPCPLKPTTFLYKKALAGVLLHYQAQIFSYLEKTETGCDTDLIHEINTFLYKDLCTKLPETFSSETKEEKLAILRKKLNRPIRVCGMVPNEGEPGGGPFWATNNDGSMSLQVVETSQIDLTNPEKLDIVRLSTHFNPVDLVCGVRDYKGKKFNLPDFIDENTGFISLKSKDGVDLKALELPGLWNGSMSDWNTIFVEVPLVTFNPVKTVNDLLRPQHQV